MKSLNKLALIGFIMLVVIIAHDVVSMIISDKKRSNQNNENLYGTNVELEENTSENAEELATNIDAVLDEDSTEEDVKYAPAMPSRVDLELENILQLPELPTGCESVALTILLKYYGFDDLEKTTIADDYLVYGDNFVISYVGDPYSSSGAGIFAPGLVKTANNFLNDRETLLNAKDITGSTPQTLYKYIANGTPVVVWNTAYFINNNPTGSYEKYNNKTYQWDTSEHCVVLGGYDANRNIVIINDPLDGIVERDADRFWMLYENLGSMAVIIQ